MAASTLTGLPYADAAARGVFSLLCEREEGLRAAFALATASFRVVSQAPLVPSREPAPNRERLSNDSGGRGAVNGDDGGGQGEEYGGCCGVDARADANLGVSGVGCRKGDGGIGSRRRWWRVRRW